MPTSFGSRGRASALIVGALTLCALQTAHAIGPRERHLSSARHGLSVEAPAGWTISQHTGYGDTIALLLHPDGSRISLSASPTNVESATALFEQSRPGLLAQKMSPSPPQRGARGSIAVDIATPGRPDRLRQLYLVRTTPSGRQAIILTLVARAAGFADHTAALEFVLNRMTLEDPTPTGANAKTVSPTVPRLTTSDPALASGSGGSGGQARPQER